VSSAPFPLFPRVILTPVFSSAYSGPTTPFNLDHRIKVLLVFSGSGGAKFPKTLQRTEEFKIGACTKQLTEGRGIGAGSPAVDAPGRDGRPEPPGAFRACPKRSRTGQSPLRVSSPLAQQWNRPSPVRDAFEAERFDRPVSDMRDSCIDRIGGIDQA
jgi:hypothetical protein